jgi:hypothetical protein
MKTGRKSGHAITMPLGTSRAFVCADMNYQYDPSDGELLRNRLKTRARGAEEELMLAVLEGAIEDFRKYAYATDAKGRLLYQEAEQWILDTGSDWFLSFESVCETLSIDPEYLRQGLLRWKQTQRKGARRSKAA